MDILYTIEKLEDQGAPAIVGVLDAQLAKEKEEDPEAFGIAHAEHLLKK